MEPNPIPGMLSSSREYTLHGKPGYGMVSLIHINTKEKFSIASSGGMLGEMENSKGTLIDM